MHGSLGMHVHGIPQEGCLTEWIWLSVSEGSRAQRCAPAPGVMAQQVLKKIVRLAPVFPSPPFRSSDFAGLRRPRLYGFHTGTRSLSNRTSSSGRREIKFGIETTAP